VDREAIRLVCVDNPLLADVLRLATFELVPDREVDKELTPLCAVLIPVEKPPTIVDRDETLLLFELNPLDKEVIWLVWVDKPVDVLVDRDTIELVAVDNPELVEVDKDVTPLATVLTPLDRDTIWLPCVESMVLVDVLRDTTLEAIVDSPEEVLVDSEEIPLTAPLSPLDKETMPLLAVLKPEDVDVEIDTNELVTVDRPLLVDVLRLTIPDAAELMPIDAEVEREARLLFVEIRAVDKEVTPLVAVLILVERLETLVESEEIPVEAEVDRDVTELATVLIDVERDAPLMLTVGPALVTDTPLDPVRDFNASVVDVVVPVSKIPTPAPSLIAPVTVPPKAKLRV
jgi:hypothetical protein